MNLITDVDVRTSKEYTVHIGTDLIDRAGALISKTLSGTGKTKTAYGKKIAVISDSNVAPLYLDRVCRSLIDEGFTAVSFVFDAGEKSKNADTLESIWNFLAENEITAARRVVGI